MRYAIVRYSTDRRDVASYSVEITRSRRRAASALREKPERAYPDDPKNFHHRVTLVYVLPAGFRTPSSKKLDQMMRDFPPPVTREYVLASFVAQHGKLALTERDL